MREEAKNWWEQARNDLKTAKIMLKNSCYDSCAFYCHQSAEKALKAVVIEKSRILPPKIHNLLNLVKLLDLDLDEIIDEIKELNPHYMTSRYPDAANGVPSEIYTKRMAERCLKSASEILTPIEKLISS